MITKDVLTLKHSGLCYTCIGADSPEIKVWLCSVSDQKIVISSFILLSHHPSCFHPTKPSFSSLNCPLCCCSLCNVYWTSSTELLTGYRSVKELKWHKNVKMSDMYASLNCPRKSDLVNSCFSVFAIFCSPFTT